MKKLAVVALAAVLSFGCAAPAFAAGPHHGAGRCLNYSEFGQSVAQNVLTPGLQSLNDRLGGVLAQARGNGAYYVDADGDGVCDNFGTYAGAGYGAQGGQGGRQMTAPGLCANGACGSNYVDADSDGICDNYGTNCPNPNGGGNYVDADGDGVCDNYGTNRQGAGNGAAGAGTGYGSHHGAGHHGGRR